MRILLSAVFIAISGLFLVASETIAGDVDAAVTFVELVSQDSNAVLVVEIRNHGSTTLTNLTYGCWTEERSSIEGESVAGSRYMAFNTGGLNWSGDLAPGQTTTARGVIAGMPADLVPMLSDQLFACGVS